MMTAWVEDNGDYIDVRGALFTVPHDERKHKELRFSISYDRIEGTCYTHLMWIDGWGEQEEPLRPDRTITLSEFWKMSKQVLSPDELNTLRDLVPFHEPLTTGRESVR